MAHDFKFGDLLICVQSACGNEGRIVRVIDQTFDPEAPEYEDWLHHDGTDMVVECLSVVPMRFVVDYQEDGEPCMIEATQAAVASYNYRLLSSPFDLIGAGEARKEQR